MGGAGFMVLGAGLIQWSAAIVTHVFGAIGPSATSAWRFLLGAAVLMVFTRPRLGSWSRHQWTGAVALGASVAFMNLCFYQAIARIPLGAAVAIEYLGPFLVSALSKRSARHYAFVLLAGLGVLAIARPGGGLAMTGILYAAGSGGRPTSLPRTRSAARPKGSADSPCPCRLRRSSRCRSPSTRRPSY
jgi:inner membrane transporter RhtA